MHQRISFRIEKWKSERAQLNRASRGSFTRFDNLFLRIDTRELFFAFEFIKSSTELFLYHGD